MKDAPIILALDVDRKADALNWVQKFSSQLDIFKVGLQLFSNEGIGVVEEIITLKKRVFIDLKLHDIPNTVAHAASVLARPGVEFITIHASGGSEMMEAAVESVKKARASNASVQTKILAVTVLTSLDDEDLREIGINHTAAGQVLNLARLARVSGVDGVVASPHEVALLRKEHGKELVIVTPGVRLDCGKVQDQKRVMTPGQAIREGSDFLVMGRSLAEATDPMGTLARCLEEIRIP